MKINEVAKLCGITVRTLHYYDEIKLLPPSVITDSGYRIYSNDDLVKLQQILFFRELDFPLTDIKEIMTNPSYNKNEALSKQKELLIKKRTRLDGLIKLVDNTIKGDTDMSFKQFDMLEIEKAKKQYATEVKERWGHTNAYTESEQKTARYDDKKWESINAEGSTILKEFGKCKELLPDSIEAQELVKKWQAYISNSFFNCTNEILSGLGMMYIGDERFTKNIDKNGEGTAVFMAAAIEVFCSK